METQIKFLRLRDVCDHTALSRSTVYRLEAAGEFPARVKVSENRSAWIAGEVHDWMNARVAERG